MQSLCFAFFVAIKKLDKKNLILKLKLIGKDENDLYVALSYLTGKSITECKCMVEVDKRVYDRLVGVIRSLKKGKPLNLVLNSQNFYGREFYVNKHVLKPRFDTEVVVEKALTYCSPNKMVLDLCCGSGVIGLTIALECNANVVLSDVSIKALKVVKKNAKRLGFNINLNNKKFLKIKNNSNFLQIIKSDLFDNISGKFDVIVSNPPYIKESEFNTLQTEVKKYDPYISLISGKTGLEFYEKIAENVKLFLKQNGVLVLEIGYTQANDVCKILTKAGFSTNVFKDYANNDRVVVCKLV